MLFKKIHSKISNLKTKQKSGHLVRNTKMNEKAHALDSVIKIKTGNEGRYDSWSCTECGHES